MPAAGDRIDVLVLIDSLGQGGAEQSLMASLPHLAPLGIDVRMALLRSASPEREDAMRDLGVPVEVIGPASGPVAVARALRPVLKRQRPDLVHATLFDPIVGAALGAIGTGVPVLASQVNTPPVVSGSQPADTSGSPWKVRAAVALEAFTCRHLVDGIHAVTPGVQESVAERFRIPVDRITVAERGRDAHRFHPPTPEERADARQVLGVPDGATVLVALGRHEPSKGFAVLVDALLQLAPTHPDLHLLLAGREGTETASLRAAIDQAGLADRFVLLGDRPDPERVLAAGDLFVLSSLREGTSGATIEAMATGLPVVATELDGLRGIVVDGQQARTVPAGDAAAMAAAIDEVLGDPDLAASLGRAGRRTFEERFTLEASVAALAALYRRSAEKGR